MLDLAKLLFFPRCAKVSERGQSLTLKYLTILFYLLCVTNAELLDKPLEQQPISPVNKPVEAPGLPDLLLPASVPAFHRQHRNHFPSGASRLWLGPAQPPDYGPLVTAAHPPSSSRLSKPSMKKSGLVPPNAGLAPPSMKKSGLVPPSAGLAPPHSAEIAPTQSSPSTLPAGLTQPPLSPHTSNCCGPDMVLKRGSQDCQCVYPLKIDLLLLNVSSNPNWKLFLNEFASQLSLKVSQIELINFYLVDLSKLNISMDITPDKGISVSSAEAFAINSSLSMHKIHLDPALVGGYQLLNITWFKPPVSAQAPRSAMSPVQAAPWLPSAPAVTVSSNKRRHPSLILIVGIVAGILIITIISTLFICFCGSNQRQKKRPHKETAKPIRTDAVPTEGSFPHPTSTRFLPYEELKEATNNFAPSSILGEGGFGRVFKGVLSDGTAVAIKRLTSGGQQGGKEFLVEVEMLSRLHHRNLVKLIGYYSSRESSQNLLCYELVPNGSLEAWLHGPLGLNCPLDWDTRMKIALDAARGLAYLHEDSQPCVIHRDFKASNILLENNFNAKVADFGLAKQAPEGQANYLSTRVMGTFGYVAPEYAMTGHLLVKSDVYSYGVVLLELLTGKKPVDMSQPSGQENLVTWARPILRDKDRLEELADLRLEGKYPKEDFVRVCTIAAACVAPEASQRPTMGEVVQSLKMVQRVTEYQDTNINSGTRPNIRQSSTTFESDGTSSMFSSGPYSGLSVFENDVSRATVFSEDLHEGR
ncbi:receptor-like serine/threonine-protein kinase ALE2 [Nicotiana tabacum]|uniref:Receptor-like serine/threonine-protein kinase ALE2 n=2 Tax=Nicotiana TaxID=4085 RepID=A0A1S3XZS9_TOBAC|nr:PREDICTED: proline-rich receptor-like protein kinase PERK3 [Nicotiana sylvestris]